MNSDGLKIPSSSECPVDVFNINTCRKLYPLFQRHGITPNGLTIISFIFGLAACMATMRKYYILAGPLFLISYFFDCCDGNYARTFNLQSQFGDTLDHVTDFIVYLLLLYILYTQSHYTLIGIFIGLILALKPQLMFQECIYGSKVNNGTLGAYHVAIKWLGLTREQCEIGIQHTKYYGAGTANLLIALGLMSLSFTT